jgi:hypothetical protein
MIALLLPLLAMSSPWWEDYDIRDRFLCGERGSLVVERNHAQASLVSGGNRITLFRESSNEPGLHFRSAAMELRLWGDDLMLEQGARKLHCIRTDQA